MEIIKYKSFIVEINSDNLYRLNSPESSELYDYVYSTYESLGEECDQVASQYGVRVKNGDNIISSAILVAGGGGATSPHSRSVLIDEDNIILIAGNSVFSLKLPDLSSNWMIECESAVLCFDLYSFFGSYLIHGEDEILLVNPYGEIEWQHSGRDIFVTASGEKDFQVFDDYVQVKDWLGYTYKFDKDGIQIR